MASKSGEAKISPDLKAEVRCLAIGITEWCAPPAVAAGFHRLRGDRLRSRWDVRVQSEELILVRICSATHRLAKPIYSFQRY